ncbi:hypothetical protein EV421DRAFT_1977233 [Armillaria borealis]|uniref:DUF6534 domain-containing protein n=1 Tax=Armillaria borealis TaxID=47425 RepID=A0AA39JZK1_9AGAR|nr:hypothetical protein EV421DRAFT_1977233 [Armillaria borealis]
MSVRVLIVFYLQLKLTNGLLTVNYYTISHFGNTDYLEKVVWSLFAEVIFNGVTGFLVQIFFTYRIWTFRRNIPIKFGTSVAYVIQGGHLPTFIELKELKPLSMSINVLAAAGDVAISAAICTFLNSAKSGLAWSNHIINRLMLFSINTELLTSIRACCSLISILSLPNTLVYFAFYFTSKSPEIFESAQIVKLPSFHSQAILFQLPFGDAQRSKGNTLVLQRARIALLSTHDNKPQVASQQIQVQIETIEHSDYMGDEINIRNDTDLVTSSGQSLDDLSKTPSDFPYTGRS